MFHFLGKFLIFLGIFLILTGIIFFFWPRIPVFGKLPGDILIKKENFIFFFPLGTSILLSIILSLLFYIFGKILK